MLFSKLASYKFYHLFGFPKTFPMNLTLGISYRCNSRCRTCNIWRRKNSGSEMSLEEFEKIFRNIGKNNLYLLIITGGEPFLHKEIAEIIFLAEKYCEPQTIVIPTNCILNKKIIEKTEEILKKISGKTHITINLSLDGIGEEHDKIRGVPENFEKFLEVYESLKKLEKIYRNFDVSIHTVISRFNYEKFPEILPFVDKLAPYNYITEIAEEREELGTKKTGITPSYEEYSRAINNLIKSKKNKTGNLKQELRIQYYKIVKEVLKQKKQIIPCYAGIASAQIDPDGEVWFCCVRAESVGNIRNAGYNLMNLWYNEKAERQRRSIRNKECYCPLASANYTNISLNAKYSAKTIFNMIKSRLK